MSNTFKSYFESKKRDLSGTSNDGGERKKAKEINIDLSLNQDMLMFFLKVSILQDVYQYYMTQVTPFR